MPPTADQLHYSETTPGSRFLANPALQEEERAGLSDIVILVVDESASQSLGDRAAQVARAVAAVEAEVAALSDEQVPVATERPASAQAVPTLDGLKVGDWLRLLVDGREKTLCLQWVSPMGGMFLFADQEGYDAVSLTRARLADKLAKGEAALGK